MKKEKRTIALILLLFFSYLVTVDLINSKGIINKNNTSLLSNHKYFVKKHDSLTNDYFLEVIDYDSIYIIKDNRILYRYYVTNHGGIPRFSKLDSIIHTKFNKL